MAFGSMGFLRSITSHLRGSISTTATYATATSSKMMPAYALTVDDFIYQETHSKEALKGEFVPVYVALGMIVLSLSLGLHTAKQEVLYCPNVRAGKKLRETIPEVVDPDRVVDEADKFIKKSFFRKVAYHVQEFDIGLRYLRDPIRKDVFTHTPRAETLKDVGIDPKQII